MTGWLALAMPGELRSHGALNELRMDFMTPAVSLPAHQRGGMLRRALLALLLLLALIGAAFQLSDTPGIMVIRALFDGGAEKAAQALERHVPPSVTAHLDLRYAANDPDARLDIYYPSQLARRERLLPTVVWVHGGGFVSGDKGQLGNYARVLAGRGYTVVSVDYTLAPRAVHPVPARQVNAALAWLVREGARYHVDGRRLVLAGDSAGANIVAQVATVITSPDYATLMQMKPAIQPAQLRGMLLFCGPYDLAMIHLDGPFGGFLRTVLRAYSGVDDPLSDAGFQRMSVLRHVTAGFPPSFITAGNSDPLLPHSQALAERLTGLGVRVDALFFAPDHEPRLAHEYQFNLDDYDARQALKRAVAFLRGVTTEAPAD